MVPNETIISSSIMRRVSIDNLEFNFIHNWFFLAYFHMANGNQIEIGIFSLNAGTLNYTDISNIDYA